MSRSRNGQAGFTVLEALVALVILAVSLTTFYRMLATSYRAQARTSMVVSTLALARSHLDSVLMDANTEAGTSAGTLANGVRWQMAIAPVATLASAEDPSSGPYWVVLEAYDRGRRPLLKLETAKVARTTR